MDAVLGDEGIINCGLLPLAEARIVSNPEGFRRERNPTKGDLKGDKEREDGHVGSQAPRSLRLLPGQTGEARFAAIVATYCEKYKEGGRGAGRERET